MGAVFLLDFYQHKTADAMRLPLLAPAADIFQRCQGTFPEVNQQERNRRLKDLACALGLERSFAYVRFYQGKPKEEVGPLWKYITTHTARHTGADMVLWGSGGIRT